MLVTHALLLVAELRRCGVDPAKPEEEALHDAIHRLVSRKPGLASRGQMHRRLYTAANFAWRTVLPALAAPVQRRALPPSPTPPVPRLPPSDRVLTADEIQGLLRTADERLWPQCACFLQLLFTTGLRISAARDVRWCQVAPAPGAAVSRVVVVREKGAVLRPVLLCEEVRRRIEALAAAAVEAGSWCASGHVLARPPHRAAVSVRQMRNWFYQACEAAGLRGAHIHPHIARHTVAHHLFDAGNSVALIAKFLGHRSLETTDRHYLRLSFEEVLQRLRWPVSPGRSIPGGSP